MKKIGFVHRLLVILLVMVMVVQVVPMGVWAALNDVAKGDPGVDTSKLNDEGAIRWPVKIYDYLNDGMLFEYANALDDGVDNNQYAGGELTPVTTLGTDYTHNRAYSEKAFGNHTTHNRGTWYTLNRVKAVPFVTPQHLHVTPGTGDNSNVEVSKFDEDNNTYYAQDRVRYMTVVYRSSGTSDDVFKLLVQNSSYSYYYGVEGTLEDSAQWTYVVLDLKEQLSNHGGDVGSLAGVWLSCEIDKGSSDYFDLSHVAYFRTSVEAHNFGKKAAAFDANPGEYLEDPTTIIKDGVEYPVMPEPKDYVLALRGVTGNYGMNLTTTSVANGQYTNGYNSDTYWTWENGANLGLKYTGSYGTNTSYETMNVMNVTTMTEVGGQKYVRLTNSSSNSGDNRILLSKFNENTADSDAPLTSSVNYAVLVYRANNLSGKRFAFWAAGHTDGTSTYKYAAMEDADSWLSSSWTNSLPFEATNGGWTYVVVPLMETITGDSAGGDTDMKYITRLKRLGIFLPALTSGKSLDLAYVAYFDTNKKATDFGTSAAGYMNSGVTVGASSTTVSSRKWNMGNNQAFAMLFASCGGSWESTGGGANSDPNGYYSWMIGYDTSSLSTSSKNTNRMDIYGNKYTANYTSSTSTNTLQNVSGTTNNIYYLSAGYTSSPEDGLPGSGYQTKVLDFDGYDLIETVTKGIMTAGLLEGSLSKDGMPVYRQEAVEYIALTLYNALTIPQKDASGNYNYNFVKGAPSSQFGGYDLNGDGVITKVDLNGDGYKETDEASVDLATALRGCLGIKFASGYDRGTYGTLGSYDETAAKGDSLMGAFKDCRDEITTCMDAAYYLLNNVFNADSYNQLQDDYSYLTMSSIPTDNGSTAYIFDAGFSTGESGKEGTDGYAQQSQSAVTMSPYVSYDSDGNLVRGEGTISLENVNSKDMFYYTWSDYYNSGSITTRFPFVPVTDAEGDYLGNPDDPNYVPGSSSYYFVDDCVRSYTEEYGTYVNRNYNYVLVSNGEFVYRAEDDLFFQFEGDDDVYLFINGELVLDIGGAHSITVAQIDVDDYVNAAREALAPLEEYGYFSGMTDAEFEALLAKLPADTDSETINAYRRWQKLDLIDGEICTFDFYYMERHGYGANMRIYTNMHITDPKLGTEKKAYQYDDEVEYGGVVDPSAAIEYNFKLTNNGNTKLYNLTFWDETIGVSLDPENGLVCNEDLNGTYLVDAFGGKLDASDLTAFVSGYDRNGELSEVHVTFEDNQALKNFLNCLDGEGLESDYDDAEITNAGSGLWVDASVTIQGIYYYLTPEQVEVGMLDNTVYVTGTTRMDPNDLASQILRSDASHRVYTSGAPVYYQWADHDLFMREQKLLDDATQAAGQSNSQLSLYEEFFDKVGNDTSKIYTRTCDKFGQNKSYSEVTSFTDAGNNWGFLINYPEGGVKSFYVLMFLKSGVNGTDSEGNVIGYASSTSVSAMKEGEFAIIRVTVYVAEVNDSTIVLDYGLKTESLDTKGELFKHDYLFGGIGSVKTKLMGVSTTQPTYLSPKDATTVVNKGTTGDDKNKTASYNRVDFDPLNLSGSKKVEAYAEDSKAAGYFTMNVAIPKAGKLITFDSNTGYYSLTGAGTVTVNAEVPLNWENVYLYYWYDGSDGVWPGIPMNYVSTGKYYLDIPGDVSHVIINNGNLQTKDLNLTAGVESTVKVTVDLQNNVSATIESVVEFTKVHVTVPEDWGETYLYYWDDNDHSDVTWPGVLLEDVDDEGYFVADIPGEASWVTVNNGDGKGKQTVNLDINAGQELWLEVAETAASTSDDGVTSYYNAEIIYTRETALIHAKVPAAWGETIKIYYWREGSETTPVTWPGVDMVLGEDGWYTLSIPGDITRVIINDGSSQTVNIAVNAGAEAWITVNDLKDSTGKHTAKVSYGADGENAGFTFTPTDFMNGEYSLWLSLVSHTTGFTPTDLGEAVDINNEVQMFKKVTVLPATVVYYEDDFAGIHYNKDNGNTFHYYSSGSGSLVQSVDQDTVYGQDATYQNGSNSSYSGNSLYEFQIKNNEPIATFDFTGTGFEIVGRTNAYDSASMTVGVYKPAEYAAYSTAYSKNSVAFNEDIVNYLAVKAKAEDMLADNKADASRYQSLMNRYNAYMAWYTQYANGAQAEDVPALDALMDPAVPGISGITAPTAPTIDSSYDMYLFYYREYLASYDTYLTRYESYIQSGQQYASDYDAYLTAYNDYLTAFENYRNQKAKLDAAWEQLKTGSGTPTSTDYYLFGYINGANYACAEDGENLGEYKFVNGKLVVTFAHASYIAVKDASNTCWYMTDGWQDKATSVTLYNTANLGNTADKLFIPGGVEVVIELTENADGTLSLSYTTAPTGKTATAKMPEAPVAPETLAQVERAEAMRKPNAIRLIPVVTQFDNEFNVGNDSIAQVPVFRIKDLTVNDLPVGSYTVEICGAPTYDFDAWGETGYDPDKLESFLKPSYLYIDGVRIFRPLGPTHDAYSDTENGAEFTELRDLILTGKVAVADFNSNGLTVSSGSVTWTEDLLKDPDLNAFKGNVVDDSGDYLLKGPNNETYMAGIGNSAVVFYVAETEAKTHSLQIAVRALDYGSFLNGRPTGLHAELQYGVKVDGAYAWKPLTTVISGTEEYYAIPYADCPVVNGNYQVVLRVTNTESTTVPMISYTSVKTLGLELKTVAGNGEATNMYYENGFLVAPDFYLVGSVNGKTYAAPAEGDAADTEYLCFNRGKLQITFTADSTFYVGMVLGSETTAFQPNGNVTSGSSAVLYSADTLGSNAGKLSFKAGSTIAFTVDEDGDVLNLSWAEAACSHNWGSGSETTAATCTSTGVMTYTCSECGGTKTETIPVTDHNYVDGVCSVCGGSNPYRRIYLDNTAGWNTPYIYTWTGSTKYTGEWPGTEMLAVEGEEGIYYYDVPVEATMVIFNDNNGAQCGNQSIPTNGNDLYTYSSNVWSSYANRDCDHNWSDGVCTKCGSACGHSWQVDLCSQCGKVRDLYLVGYINGADYGIAGDYSNLGEYKFVDGKITVTFAQDSYVVIKTGDNAASYWAESFISGTSGKLYQGKGEKMFVPGNVEVTFTATVNHSEDSITLSYVTGSTMATALNMITLRNQLAATTVVEGDVVSTLTQPTISLKDASLTFEDAVQYNIYFTAEDLADVVEMGLITFNSKLTDGTIDDAVDIIPGFTTVGDRYRVHTNGIAAKDMGDKLYFKVYAKLADGTYAYSKVAYYSAVMYAQNILASDKHTAETKALVVALMNYGAAAQNYFGKSGSMNDFLTDAHKALVQAYDGTMMDAYVLADKTKSGAFAATGGFGSIKPSVSFEGAFAINYYVLPENTVDGEVTFYYWSEADYNASEELTEENATMVMTLSGDSYVAKISGIAPKNLDDTVYVAAKYTSGDTTYYSGVKAYSIGAYCVNMASLKSASAMSALAEATAVYGYYTKLYFGKI